MPPAERKALLLLMSVAVVGHLVLAWTRRPDPSAPPGDVRLLGPSGGNNPAGHRDSSAQAGRPVGPGERIDLDRAGPAELMRLPRIGAGLARRIAEERAAHGPFGSLEGLRRVAGVGDAMLAAIGEHAEFSAAGEVSGAPPPLSPTPVASHESSVSAVPERTDGVAPAPSSPQPVDLNQGTEAEFERLPGIGPSLARRIVQYRSRHGAFLAVDSLVHVPGIGPATLARIRGLVTVR
jgi:competence protein ComEA